MIRIFIQHVFWEVMVWHNQRNVFYFESIEFFQSHRLFIANMNRIDITEENSVKLKEIRFLLIED
jgi:hypothetical protein